MPTGSVPLQNSHTLTEILSQPEIWLGACEQAKSSAAFQSAVTRMRDARETLFLGCGTSFYLAEAAAATWTLFTGSSRGRCRHRSRCCFRNLRYCNRRDAGGGDFAIGSDLRSGSSSGGTNARLPKYRRWELLVQQARNLRGPAVRQLS